MCVYDAQKIWVVSNIQYMYIVQTTRRENVHLDLSLAQANEWARNPPSLAQCLLFCVISLAYKNFFSSKRYIVSLNFCVVSTSLA